MQLSEEQWWHVKIVSTTSHGPACRACQSGTVGTRAWCSEDVMPASELAAEIAKLGAVYGSVGAESPRPGGSCRWTWAERAGSHGFSDMIIASPIR